MLIEIRRLPSGFWSVWIDGTWIDAALPTESAARSLAKSIEQNGK